MRKETTSVFNRLIKLYGSRSLEMNTRTPLEDFTTEIFASILDSNPVVLSAFLSEIVGIDQECITSSRISVKTQVHYRVVGKAACRVDLVIRGDGFLCFIENKVNSSEGYRQLPKYSSLLITQREEKKYLCYCTKYYEERRKGIKQYRWADVHKLLYRIESDNIITHFMEFLRRNGMGSSNELTQDDLHVMQNVVEVFGKLGAILDEVKHDYDQISGRRARYNERYNQVGRHQRYVCYDKNVLEGDDYSELGFGFDLSEVPSLYVWIWAHERSAIWSRHDELLFNIFPDGKRHDRSYLAFLTPLSDMLGKQGMQEEIRRWFAEKFERIVQYEGFKKNIQEPQEEVEDEEDV